MKSSLLLAISLLYWPQFYNDDDDVVTPPFVEHVKQQYEAIRGTDAFGMAHTIVFDVSLLTYLLALEFATFSWLVRLGTDDRPLLDKRSVKEDIKRFLMEPDEISQQRANYVSLILFISCRSAESHAHFSRLHFAGDFQSKRISYQSDRGGEIL